MKYDINNSTQAKNQTSEIVVIDLTALSILKQPITCCLGYLCLLWNPSPCLVFCFTCQIFHLASFWFSVKSHSIPLSRCNFKDGTNSESPAESDIKGCRGKTRCWVLFHTTYFRHVELYSINFLFIKNRQIGQFDGRWLGRYSEETSTRDEIEAAENAAMENQCNFNDLYF
jgi:hypothetical protein